MRLAELIRELSACQVQVRLDPKDRGLRISAPPGAIDGRLLDRLRAVKPVMCDRLARVLTLPSDLLERRVACAEEEIRSGCDSRDGRELTDSELATVKSALAEAEADLALSHMASRSQNDSESPTQRGAEPGITSEPTNPTDSTNSKDDSMKLGKLFPSRFLKAEDCDPPIQVTITEVRQELVGDKDVKPVVYLRDQKPLVLNKTNGKVIEALADTDETDDWAGVEIELYATETELRGERVPCIRVRAPRPTRKTHPLPPEYEDDAPHDEQEPSFVDDAPHDEQEPSLV